MRLILTTVSDQAVADKLTTKLMTTRLVGCISQIPGIISAYFWQGKLVRDSEILLLIKTQADLEKDVYAWLKNNHPYETPEIISLKPETVAQKYRDWLLKETALAHRRELKKN